MSSSLAQLKATVDQINNKKMYYQLMKELFPAEWLPIIITMIFFLGGRSRTPRLLAIFTRPENTHTVSRYQLKWHHHNVMLKNSRKIKYKYRNKIAEITPILVSL